MEKQRTHLTPVGVQEVVNLGIEFGETACSWLNNDGEWSLETTETAQWYYDTPDTIYEELIPAPNLQEVLEVLPPSIQLFNGGSVFKIVLSVKLFCGWYCNYETLTAQIGESVTYFNNPLDAVMDRLRYVIAHYPETLTKTE